MGLFSFLKNAGSKLFKSDEVKKAEASADVNKVHQSKLLVLEATIRSNQLPIDDLDLKLDGSSVIVKGECPDQKTKEKIVLVLGNVDGIDCVDDQISVQITEPESQFYTVKSGDSLSKIAKAYYGNAMKYPVIFEANKPMLKDPNLIYPGQVLRIPPLSEH